MEFFPEGYLGFAILLEFKFEVTFQACLTRAISLINTEFHGTEVVNPCPPPPIVLFYLIATGN